MQDQAHNTRVHTELLMIPVAYIVWSGDQQELSVELSYSTEEPDSQNPARRQHRAGLTESRQEAAPCWTHRIPPGGSTVLGRQEQVRTTRAESH